MAVVSSPQKPHILIIPGAWHPGSVMTLFVKSLEAAGFSAEALSLRSVGNVGVTVQDDEAQVKSALIPLIDEGRDVVIFAHSYGGIVTAGVVSDTSLDKLSREAQGLKGGVVGVVYLASLLAMQDESVFQLSGGKWWDNIDLERTEREGLAYTLSQADTFYGDCSEELASSIVATLKPHSVAAIKSTPSSVRWQGVYDGRRAYIRCLQDKALPVAFQDHFIARTEVEWLIKTMDSSHSPFLSMPAKLTGVLQEIIEEFAKK